MRRRTTWGDVHDRPDTLTRVRAPARSLPHALGCGRPGVRCLACDVNAALEPVDLTAQHDVPDDGSDDDPWETA